MLKVHERDVLLVTGDRSWEVVSGIQEYIDLLEGRNLNHVRIRSKLPRLDLLESELPGIRKFQPQAIVAIGGGKVIDCGKIIAGLTNCSDEPLSAIKAGLVGTHVVPMPMTCQGVSPRTTRRITTLKNCRTKKFSGWPTTSICVSTFVASRGSTTTSSVSSHTWKRGGRWTTP